MNIQDHLTLPVDLFPKICRTCLCEGESESISLVYDSQTLAEILSELASMKVKIDDDLPQNICKKCIQNLIQARTFLRQCKESETNLRNILMTVSNVKEEIASSDEEYIYQSETDTYESLRTHSSLKEENEFNGEEEEVTIKTGEQGSIITIYNSEELTPKEIEFIAVDNIYENVEISNENKREVEISNNKETCKAKDIILKKYNCTFCNLVFDDAKELCSHRCKVNLYNHSCELCCIKFSSMYRLQEHMTIHSNVKLLQCDVCQMHFSNNGNLVQYEKSHTGKKNYVCEVCAKDFAMLKTFNKETPETLAQTKPPSVEKLAKTSTQRSRECKARKRAQKMQLPVEKLAKSAAQRTREYRARRKAIKNASNLHIERLTKSAAQRSREYRARKKAMKNASNLHPVATVCSSNKVIKNFVSLLNHQPSEQNSTDNVVVQADTHHSLSEHLTASREREESGNNETILAKTKKPAKTQAERSREYRQRLKAKEQQIMIEAGACQYYVVVTDSSRPQNTGLV